MARLIDNFSSICKRCDHYLVCKYADNETAECSQYKAPTVDAVPVVRCKDCKHFVKEENGCGHHGYFYPVHVQEDDFCSCGERRIDV